MLDREDECLVVSEIVIVGIAFVRFSSVTVARRSETPAPICPAFRIDGLTGKIQESYYIKSFQFYLFTEKSEKNKGREA